jgi:radical SAM protein with 4Fe4S-binding SPASM domain
VEHLTPTVKSIDYSQITSASNHLQTQNGADFSPDTQICPQGSYMMQINPDGNVVPCCNMSYPAVMGNVQEASVREIWRGAAYNQFCRAMLESRASASPVCGECLLFRYGLHEEDLLDDAANKLREAYAATQANA